MKHALLAVPAVALFAVGALAQTDTTTGATVGTETTTEVDASTSFGTNWPLSIGTTFFSDAENSTLRTSAEISAGWQSMSQEDRDMIKADCVAFMAEHGDAAAGASTDAATSTGTDASTDTTAGASTDTATTGTATDTTAGASTDTASGTTSTEGTISTAVGYDLTEMKAICEAVETF